MTCTNAVKQFGTFVLTCGTYATFRARGSQGKKQASA